MRICTKNAIAGMVLALIQTLAIAQISPEVAEALTRKSGTWAQLADFNQHVKAGMMQSPDLSKLGRLEIERMVQVADDAFSSAKLREGFVRSLSQKLNDAQSKESLRWFDSPTGKLMTALEGASAADTVDTNSMLQDGNELLNKVSEKRRILLTRLVKLTRAAEWLASIQVNIAVGILQGASAAGPAEAFRPLDELRSALESKRPQMVAAMSGVSLSLFARTYKTVSDKDLENYLKFLSSKSGTATGIAMIEALDDTLTNAARAFGQGIPIPKPAI